VFERHKAQTALLEYPARQVWREMPLTILRTSFVNAMFGGAFFLYFVFGTSYMKAVGYPGSEPETIGLIAAAFMLVFMIVGSLFADIINRRTILLIAAGVFLISAIPYFYLINTAAFSLRRSQRLSVLGSYSVLATARSRPSIRRISRPATAPRARTQAIKSPRSMAAG
jgi:MFS family permease